MLCKSLTAGLVGLAGLLAWSGLARADDTVRLNLTDNVPAKTLAQGGEDADTVAVAWRGGGYRGGVAYRGVAYRGGGYRGVAYRGGYAWRGGWNGGWRAGYGWRPGWGYGWGRPYWYGARYGGWPYWYNRPYVSIGVGSYPVYYQPYYYSSPVYYSVPAVTMPYATGVPVEGPSTLPPPVLQTPGPSGTYPYDGGPRAPVPLPKTIEPAPAAVPRTPKPTVPLEGRRVSLPKQETKWAYPAYGEQPRQTSFATERTVVLESESVRKP
jgi:hypothetical protein